MSAKREQARKAAAEGHAAKNAAQAEAGDHARDVIPTDAPHPRTNAWDRFAP